MEAGVVSDQWMIEDLLRPMEPKLVNSSRLDLGGIQND
jgi:hypothetical protein